MLPEGKPDDSTAAPKNHRHHRSRCTRKCLDSGQPSAPPEGGPDDLRPRRHGCYTADRLPVSRAPPFVHCLTPEGAVLCTTTGLLGAARTPEDVLRSAPPRCPSRDWRCASSRSTRRQLAWRGRTPKGPPWLPTPAGKPLEVGSGQTDIASMRETGRDEVPTRPEGRVPTWIRRVRSRSCVTHLVGGRRHGHRTSEEIPCSQREGPKPLSASPRSRGRCFLPRAPKRPRNPEAGEPARVNG
jgi:hypothetical protein